MSQVVQYETIGDVSAYKFDGGVGRNNDSNIIDNNQQARLSAKEEFEIWKKETLALSRLNQVSQYLTTKSIKIPTKEEAEQNESLMEIYKQNCKAWDIVTGGLQRSPLSIVGRFKDKKNTYCAWNALIQNYEKEEEEKDREILIEVTKQWLECRLDDIETDPKIYFSKLDRINRKFEKIKKKYKKDENQIIAHIFQSVHNEYVPIIVDVMMNLNELNKKQLQEIKGRIRSFWKDELKRGTLKNINASKALKSSKGFQKCNRLKKHPVKKASNMKLKKKKKICMYCNKKGHSEAKCYKKKRDAKKAHKVAVNSMLCGFEKMNID